MTISSKPILISDIQAEFGGNDSYPNGGLNQYYRGGPNVPDTPANQKISTSGEIDFAMFLGASAAIPVSGGGGGGGSTPPVTVAQANLVYTSTSRLVIPAGVNTFYVKWSQGGGGGGGTGHAQGPSGGGGGAAGGLSQDQGPFNCNPGDIVDIVIGAGAAPGGSGGDTYINLSGVTIVRGSGGMQGSDGTIGQYTNFSAGGDNASAFPPIFTPGVGGDGGTGPGNPGAAGQSGVSDISSGNGGNGGNSAFDVGGPGGGPAQNGQDASLNNNKGGAGGGGGGFAPNTAPYYWQGGYGARGFAQIGYPGLQ